MELLKFRCTGCGHCCRNLRVAVTYRDVQRLTAKSGLSPEALVAWLSPSEVDMTGEPESFVELSTGRRLMVLQQRDDACVLLDADNRCTQYDARPQDCRTFPFNPTFSTELPRTLKRLELLPGDGCDYRLDGENEPQQIAEADATRWRELAEYHASVARWNRLALRRRHFGHRAGTPAAFFDFLSRPEQQITGS